MYILKILSAIKKNENQRTQRLYIWNNYRWVVFSKENSYYSMKHQKRKDLLLLTTKLIEKIPYATNARQQYQIFFKNKNKKSAEQLKIITQ